MRSDLITVAGLTPQIVTETLWCLAQQKPHPAAVGTVHIATTAGARSAIESALCGSGGVLERLSRDWGIPVPKVNIHVFPGSGHTPLDDIRTSEDSLAFATGITELVRELTEDPELTLYASIAGGRKTMGFYLGHAMSLFGRQQDRLSHVLVPPEVEACQEFWYPTPRPVHVRNRYGASVDISAARVELAEIPFVRVRNRLSAAELAAAVSDPGSLYRKAQVAVDRNDADAQASIAVSAVLAASAAAAQTIDARPLASVLATLRRGTILTLRLVVDPAATPRLTVKVDCTARAGSLDDARASLERTVADLLHAVDLNRSGYRAASGTMGTVNFSTPTWSVHIVPEGTQLQGFEAQHLGFTVLSTRDSDTAPPLRMGVPIVGPPQTEFPVRALAACGLRSELLWSIEPVSLVGDERRAVEIYRDFLMRAPRTASGAVRLSDQAVLSQPEFEALIESASQWSHRPEGFRAKVTIRAEAPLPDALVASIGRAAWGARPFRVISGEVSGDRDAGVDLSNCIHHDDRMSFELPPLAELRSAGFETVWPAPQQMAPADGVILGWADTHAIRLAAADRARHLYVIGSTGTGKSTLLHNMIVQDIEAGEGVFVLDPHGDLVDQVLRSVPERRTDDVVLLDAGDVEYPFGVNFLETDPSDPDLSASFAVSELLAIFHWLYKDIPVAIGPAFEQYFTVVLNLLLGNEKWPQPTMIDIARVLSEKAFRAWLREGCRNPAVLMTLDMLQAAGGEASWGNLAPYVSNKINRLTLNALLRNICCQTSTTIDLRSAMDRSHIVLVKLPKGRLPEIDVRLLGMLLIGKLFGAALGRGRDTSASRRPMHVYIDEFQNFVTGTVGQMMAEARKYGLRLTLANQNLAQIDPQLREIVLGNAASLLAFRVGPADAAALESYYAPALAKYDLQAMGNFQCAARMLSGGVPVVPPFVLTTEPPRSPGGRCAAPDELVALSRTRYARVRADVDKEVAGRLRAILP